MWEYEKLNKNAKKSWRIARLIGALIGGITVFLLYAAFSRMIDDFHEIRWIFLISNIFLISMLLINAFIYPIIEYKQWKYIITRDKIEFTKGIFFVKRVIIPIIRIQHIQLNQGPINKFFKLYDISIFTAGGQHKIPNIECKKAEEISEFLKELIKEKLNGKADESNENIILDKELDNYDEIKQV